MRLILFILLLALIPASNASILVYVSSNNSADYLSIYDNNNLNGNYTKQAPASLGYPSPNLKKFVPHPAENSTFKGCYSNDLNTPCTTQQWDNVTYETIFSSSYTPNVYYFAFENKTPEINGSGWAGGSNELAPQEVMSASNIMPNYDSITPTHSSLFCRITPTDNWVRTSIPGVYGCDKSNIIDIANVTANDLPSGGASHRIAPSELGIIIVKLNNYQGSGTIKYKLENIDLNKVLVKPDDFSFSIPACGGNCGWAYWWYQSYFFFGRYDWEVKETGNYRMSAITSWGNVSYDFKVINSSSSYVPPSPVVTPTPTINYNVGALINNNNLDVHACAGINRGYFYMLGPLNPQQQKYATYVNEYSCTDFSIAKSDMIASGGAGIWTLAIFDESDMSASKAMFQVNITSGVTLLFTSTPAGANVYINSSLKGTTPFNYNPGTQTDFHFKFNKSGYVDAIFDARYTLSNTVNVNLVPMPGSTPRITPIGNPVTPPIDTSHEPVVSGLNRLFFAWTGLLSGLDDTLRILIFIVIVGICAWKWSTIGAGVGILISAVLGAIPYYIMILMFIVALCALYYKLKQPVRV